MGSTGRLGSKDNDVSMCSTQIRTIYSITRLILKQGMVQSSQLKCFASNIIPLVCVPCERGEEVFLEKHQGSNGDSDLLSHQDGEALSEASTNTLS